MTVKDTVGDPDIYQYEDDENEEESREVEMKLMGDIDSMSRTTERRLLDGKQDRSGSRGPHTPHVRQSSLA